MIYTIIIYSIYWTAGGTCRIGACNVCIIFSCRAGSPAQFPQDIDLVNVSQILQLATDM